MRFPHYIACYVDFCEVLCTRRFDSAEQLDAWLKETEHRATVITIDAPIPCWDGVTVTVDEGVTIEES
jgi:hypothetical protein